MANAPASRADTGVLPALPAHVGDRCVAGQVACVDGTSGVFCGADGSFRAMTCHGANGCKTEARKVLCDNDIAARGDGCNSPGDGACTADHMMMLECKSDAFVLADTCKGPGACKIAGNSLVCDNDMADVGDPCGNAGNFACSSGDHEMALRCEGGRFGAIQSCRGPKACRILHPRPKATDIDCDFSVAAENDLCFFPGTETCSTDNRSRLSCKGGKYTEPTRCPGPNGCKFSLKPERAVCDGVPATPPAPAHPMGKP